MTKLAHLSYGCLYCKWSDNFHRPVLFPSDLLMLDMLIL